MIKVYLRCPWEHADLWKEALGWLHTSVHFGNVSHGEGTSWINGTKYPATLMFNNEDDAIVFVLKFPDFARIRNVIDKTELPCD